MASWCMACGKWHWANGCAQPEVERAHRDIDRVYATFERAVWLVAAALAREFAEMLRAARSERGTDQ